MCSFDLCSLFTFGPLFWGTINICCDSLCHSSLSPLDIPEKEFLELMKFGIPSVEFRFDDVMNRQIDGVAMGFPLGPALANI